MIRKIKRNIARRNMRKCGLTKINKINKDCTKGAPERNSFFSLNWREYLII